MKFFMEPVIEVEKFEIVHKICQQERHKTRKATLNLLRLARKVKYSL